MTDHAWGAPGPHDIDPEYPEAEFRVGDFWYVVTVCPPVMPVWLARAFSSSLAEPAMLILGVPLLWICWKIDDRVKVSVSRRRHRRAFFRMVHVEYFGTMEEAERRQLEVRSEWIHGDHEDDAPLGLSEVVAAYREARRVVARGRD